MRLFIGLIALAVALSVGSAPLSYAGPMDPVPTEKKDKEKDKGTSSPKAFASDDQIEKKDDKGGR